MAKYEGAEEAPAGFREAPEQYEHREYRTTELAKEAGITVRTLRFYRERKLLPAPRREGRIAWYNEHHLARLRTIGALLDRGHTLGGIAELLNAFEKGRDVRDILGLESAIAVPWSGEKRVRLTPEQLADYFADNVTPENLADSLDLGYITVEGDELVHISHRLLNASSALAGRGIPLSALLAAAREVRAHADALAGLFSRLIRTHLLADVLDRTPPGEPLGVAETAEIAETVEALRPLAKSVVDAELALAMDRRIRAELDAWMKERRSE